jgi:TDG/mug DNA glycosylase family protein
MQDNAETPARYASATSTAVTESPDSVFPDAEGHGAVTPSRPVASQTERSAGPRGNGEQPFIASPIKSINGMPPGKWRERYGSVCRTCFEDSVPCDHYPELPLRCLFIGHNPSLHAFTSGFSYSNPSNHFWSLLTGRFGTAPTPLGGKPPYVGVLPAWERERQNDIGIHCGVGLTNMGVEPGNDSSKYTAVQLRRWRTDLFAALQGHCRRAAQVVMVLRRIARSDTPKPAPSVPAAAPGKRSRQESELKYDARACVADPSQYASFPRHDRQWARAISATTANEILAVLSLGRGIDLKSCPDDALLAACAPVVVAFEGKGHWNSMFSKPPP